MRTQIGCMLVVLLAGCDSGFDPGSRVNKLRLLALRADQPFAAPEQTVTLTPLLANPSDAEISWAFATCSDPPASSVESCLGALDGDFEPIDPDADSLEVDIGARADYVRSGVLGAVVAACPGTIETGTTKVVCRDANGAQLPLNRFELGMKRIFVHEHDRNQNPSIEALLWDGEEWAEDAIKEVDVCDSDKSDVDDCPSAARHQISVQTSAPEQGVSERDVPFEEQQVVQFYSTHGLFARELRIASEANTTWAAQRGDDPIATFWFVVRDDRGGVDWQVRRVRVRN